MAARSRYVDSLVPGARRPADAIECLRLHLASGAAYDWIILADEPTMIEAVRRSREDWCRNWFPVDISSTDPDILIRKTMFLAAAREADLPIPHSISASSPDEIRAAARSIGFPLLVKPSEGSTGRGIVRTGDAAELEALMPAAGSFVVQSLIDGRTGGTLVLYDRGVPLWWHSSLRVQFWPQPYGPSCQRRSFHLPEFEGLVKKVGTMLGLTGLCEVEWILPDDGGAPLIIEFNPRPPSFHAIAERMGADLPGAIRAFLGGDRTVTPPVAGPEGPVIRLFPEDAIRAAACLDWHGCALWLSGSAGPLPWDDPALLRAYGKRVLVSFARALIKRS